MYYFFYSGSYTCYTSIKLYLIGIIKYNMPFWEIKTACFAHSDYSIYLLGNFEYFSSLIYLLKNMLYII